MFKVSVCNKKTKASFEFLDNLRKWRRTWDSIHGPLRNNRFNRRFMTGSWPKNGLVSTNCSLKALNSGSFRGLKDHKRIYNLKRTFLTLTGRVQSFKRKREFWIWKNIEMIFNSLNHQSHILIYQFLKWPLLIKNWLYHTYCRILNYIILYRLFITWKFIVGCVGPPIRVREILFISVQKGSSRFREDTEIT